MKAEIELKSSLLSQADQNHAYHDVCLRNCCEAARAFAQAQGGIAVISDLVNDAGYIYAGTFGLSLGLGAETVFDSAFEDVVFSYIDEEQLSDSHILELRYIELVKSLPATERQCYVKSSRLTMRHAGREVPVVHQTRYLEVTERGGINIALCTYMPTGFAGDGGFEGHILDLRTGLPVSDERLQSLDNRILSRREREVLRFLSEGLSSKQIADRLNISVNTVYRHRQNIIDRLNVVNTAEAVRIGLRMRLV